MALGSVVFNFEIQLSDVDRGVYEALSIKAAQHPSESDAYLVARVLALALEHQEGARFGPGLAEPDEPAVGVWELTGQRVAWIEVGTPDLARIHRACKAAERVVVYCHREPSAWLRSLQGQRVHAPERFRWVELDREVIGQIAARLQRRTTWNLTVSEGAAWLDADGESFGFSVERRPWPG